MDAGCRAAFSSGVVYDMQFLGGFKNALLGEEGVFLIRLEEPGRVHLQSLPLSRLADRIIQASRLDICRAGAKEAVKAGARARLCP